MTLLELALVMKSLGCEAAMNLDGGGSTTMWIRSLGVVNHPCDNGRFDHDGERAVTDAVCVIAPLVLLRDEQHARCEPADGWQSGAHRDAVEGDFAVLAADDADGATARAVFEFAVDAPGRYRLELRWPKVRGGVCAVECSFAGREVVRVDGRRKPSRWQQIDAADLVVGSHEVVLTRVSAGQFAIDAIRLVEAK